MNKQTSNTKGRGDTPRTDALWQARALLSATGGDTAKE